MTRVGRPSPVRPNLNLFIEPRDCRRAYLGALGGGDCAPRLGDFQGVSERRRAKIGADQRNNGADLGEPEPDREILRPVAHNKSGALAARNARAKRPSRILVHTRFERAEAEALAVAHKRCSIAILASPLGDSPRQDMLGITSRLRGGLESPQPGPGRRRRGGVVRSGRVHLNASWRRANVRDSPGLRRTFVAMSIKTPLEVEAKSTVFSRLAPAFAPSFSERMSALRCLYG